jgi:hypothetical protein
MTNDRPQGAARPSPWRRLARKDVLSGLLFIAVAVFGLWASRDYHIGTALRMGTGYVPRLLCRVLLGLGAIVLVKGLSSAGTGANFDRLRDWRAIVFVPASLVVFGLALDRAGVVIATLLLVGVASLSARDSRPIETAVTAVLLTLITFAIFVWGLELPIPVWPGG